jgi:hypothetical protein
VGGGVVQLQNTKGRPAGLLDGIVVSLVFCIVVGCCRHQPPGTFWLVFLSAQLCSMLSEMSLWCCSCCMDTHTPYCTEKRVRVRALMPSAAAMRRRGRVWCLCGDSGAVLCAHPRGSLYYCTTDQRRPVNDCVSDLVCGSMSL